MKLVLYDFDIALAKAQKYCAYQERCQWDVEKKFWDWNVDEIIRDEIMADLISKGFINEERFAEQFTKGKFRIKKWGKQKIRMELQKRKISDYSINKAIENIDDEDYLLTLHKLIAKKNQGLQTENEFQKKQKIANYLHAKGYESELIWDNLHGIENE
jgi:regulatory protein